MSTPALIMWAVVACVGLPAAFRNPTALALVASWLVSELLFQANGLNVSASFKADIAVIAVIYAKMIWSCGPKSYQTMRQQLRCFVTDLTIPDRLIAAIFLLGVWPLYVLNLHPYYKWWLLWGLTILQILLAGAEAALSFRHDVKVRASPDDPSGNGLALAGIYRRDG